ncbi:recombinase family protein [Salinicoccus sp. ID82-1]|uniref:recombinase family protein n=1 Tax=Salinicoccus sp. ID82-1 TaxID=2820269 RepID=UPI001F1DD885|nr:recombinase family protein [Salinicoccus sp. ID82-1]MCG1010517.1 recombinase family protein [Salinicoccus sp. ID82-1]
MKYGYVRPVEMIDSMEQQQKTLHKHVDHIYQEIHDKAKGRDQLELMMSAIQPGDTLFATDLFILADSTKQLVDLVNEASGKEAGIVVLNKNLTIDSETAFTFGHSLNLLSEFQSDVVKFRTRMGMTEATTKGKQLGRPKRSDENIKKAIKMYMSKKYTLDEIKEETNISRATLYRHLDL